MNRRLTIPEQIEFMATDMEYIASMLRMMAKGTLPADKFGTVAHTTKCLIEWLPQEAKKVAGLLERSASEEFDIEAHTHRNTPKWRRPRRKGS
jgi:hypothetical protein